MRKIRARTKEALIGAMGRALGAVSAQDVQGFFVHCGYRPLAQPAMKGAVIWLPTSITVYPAAC